MFSRKDAIRLRESLQPMDFLQTTAPTQLQQTYRDYYGLNFGDSQRPVSHSMGVLASNEFQLVCQHFKIPLELQCGTVFLLHGYFDHVGLYGHLIAHYLRAGYSVATFDLPGHGLSSGTPASIASFQLYSDALLACMELAQAHGVHSPWIVCGQSTGAAIIMDALLERQLATRFTIDAYILLAPLLRPRNWFLSKLLFRLTPWFLTSTKRHFASNSHDPALLSLLQHLDPLQSRLLPTA